MQSDYKFNFEGGNDGRLETLENDEMDEEDDEDFDPESFEMMNEGEED